jgi:hypothetical protein
MSAHGRRRQTSQSSQNAEADREPVTLGVQGGRVAGSINGLHFSWVMYRLTRFEIKLGKANRTGS